jgi:hypothetical protein
MKPARQLWLLVPHALSAVCFGTAFAWRSAVGTNRTEPDLYLAVAGLVALAIAVVATIVGVALVFRIDVRRYWPWISIHLAAVCVAFLIAGDWLGAHIA